MTTKPRPAPRRRGSLTPRPSAPSTTPTSARSTAAHNTRGASTTTYIRAQLPEVATALAALTGEPHPLAETLG